MMLFILFVILFQVAGSLVLDLNDVVNLNVCNIVQVAG